MNVRSSVPGSSYGSLSGTSMAAPHVAGAIALLWSDDAGLRRNVAATKLALDDSATDTAGGCGGTTDDNNTFGEGRLDALALVNAARDGAHDRWADTLHEHRPVVGEHHQHPMIGVARRGHPDHCCLARVRSGR